jgi:hypothetical protein
VDDIDQIRREMALIRRDLHYDVSEVVQGAESLLNWRAQVRKMPWVAMGLAALVGYWVVPRKKSVVSQFTEPVARNQPARIVSARPEPIFSARNVIGNVFGFVWPIALSIARSYVIQASENYLESRHVNRSRTKSKSPEISTRRF